MKTKKIYCICGSGKRYSTCCAPQKKVIIFDPPWQKLRDTSKFIIHQHLIPYVEKYDPNFKQQAWDEFWIGEQEWPERVLEASFNTFFIPWFLFQRNSKNEGTLAWHYFKNYGDVLNQYQQRFIQAACQAPFFFYEVVEVIPGVQLVLENLLSHDIYTVKELELSERVVIGEIVFASLLEMNEQKLILGYSPYVLPSNFYQLLVEFGRDLQKSSYFNSTRRMLRIELIKNEFLRLLKTLIQTVDKEKNKVFNTQLFSECIISKT